MEVKEKIELDLFDTSPKASIKCSIGGWNGIAYKISRMDLDKYKDENELKRHGVYFLFGKSEDEDSDSIYIGKAGERQNREGILLRVKEHETDQYKDFWTEVIVFTTTDNKHGLSEISYLEHRFYVIASEAKNYTIMNDKTPSPGNISDGDKSVLEKFINYAKIVVSILGHKVFEKSGGIEFLCGKAKGKRTVNGFTVLAGSCIKQVTSDGYIPAIKLRKKFASKINDNWELLEDISFSSPSAAAGFVLGRSSNGYTEWKTLDKRTLKDVVDVSEV